MTLRVTGGYLGGRRLRSPSGRSTRPTGARVREAWFSAISDRIPGATVLDLFAGSGALGIEALSRGAERVTFVESSRTAMAVLRQNVAALDLESRSEFVRADVFRTLVRFSEPAAVCDLALADPPYDSSFARQVVQVWLERPFASMLCVEHARSGLAGVQPDWTRVYGDTALSFFIGRGRTE
ncbi:MAG: 16S rRNA (guanine(966)-N(2))-methyltransferase RsmD [Gemmatimonadota bacterium]|nr:16S rRNA (guanine(966)-N(2))-methyltransferase RsmD [Gemmatimonadota bacterium]